VEHRARQNRFGALRQKRLDKIEQNKNNTSIHFWTGEPIMLRAVLEEALALASITLFLATIAVWAQVFGVV
jgi:hypothetical protein